MLRTFLLLCGVALVALALAAAPAQAQTQSPACQAGSTACVDAVIREMRERFAPLAESCDHDAIFSLAYLRTTEEYRRAVRNPRFFRDTRLVNRQVDAFAQEYFDAFDAWHGGNGAAAPAAWQAAFEAAEMREVTGAGNLLLGMNAHVQRDLPFVLVELGLVRPDGSSRKDDHDRVNVILRRVYRPLIRELARRFDPTIDDRDVPTGYDDRTLLQLLFSWREIAWQNAVRLADNPEYGTVIETYAAAEAAQIRAGTQYVAPVQNSSARDAYCAEHHDDGRR